MSTDETGLAKASRLYDQLIALRTESWNPTLENLICDAGLVVAKLAHERAEARTYWERIIQELDRRPAAPVTASPKRKPTIGESKQLTLVSETLQ